ncbi:hypothetical protein Tco_1028493 [Tanacetum coccineum]|uniref:Uncharacterized protein n=1 Tax=Tanacetum coccineum TaxID=301880 RepID=A0ABQ5G2J5_9ASTR
MTDSNERKHVLDYTHVNLHYVEDQRKNLLGKFNSLNQELSSCKSELNDLRNTKTLNLSLQDEITKLSLENESLKDEISNLKKVIEKWTCSRVTLDQLLSEQIPGNISKASEIFPDITSDSETEQRPLPPLPKLTGAEPANSSKFPSLTNLTLTKTVPKKTHLTSKNVSTVKGKAGSKPPSISESYLDKNSDLTTEKLVLTLMEEVKGLKEHIKLPTDTSPSESQSSSSKSAVGKQRPWFEPCKHRGYSRELGPKVVFRDNSLGDTEGYGSVNCNGITFTRVAYMNVFNIRRQELEESFHVTFSEDDEASSQSSTEGDEINFNENITFPDDEFSQHRNKISQNSGMRSCPYHETPESTTSNDRPFINTHESEDNPEPAKVQVSIINEPISEAILLISETSQSEGPPLPQDRWSRDGHIELVNIIGEPLAGITTRSRIRYSEAAFTYECLYVNFLSEIKPKRLSKALKEEGWIIAMQDELN